MSRCKNNAVKKLKTCSDEQSINILVEKFPLRLTKRQIAGVC
ncbi:hypothetical protein [Desulfofundulus salinus]|nr:hypothetical protein [Desulfofundulus salinum]